MIKTAQRREHGFTLVELLIVITIIGILATAVIAAINPLEQAKKARDAARKADATQFQRAITSYFVTNGCLPWEGGLGAACPAAPGQAVATAQINAANMAVNGSTGAFGGLRMTAGAGGELGANFANRDSIRNGNLFITVSAATTGNTGSVNICFEPESSSARVGTTTNLGVLRNAANTANGAACGGVVYNGTISTQSPACYICVP